MRNRTLLPAVTAVYLAAAFHLYMGLDPGCLGIVLLSAVSVGMLLSGLLFFLPGRAGEKAGAGISVLLGFVFYAECICKTILQQYYPLIGGIATAAGNRLTDYRAAVFQAAGEQWMAAVLFLLIPAGAVVLLPRMCHRKSVIAGPQEKDQKPESADSQKPGEEVQDGRRPGMSRRKKGLACIAAAVSAHMLMLALIFGFPWEGDFTPERLYRTDLYTDDQVAQLGLLNMLRLDVVHALFGAGEEAVPEVREMETGTEETKETAAQADPDPGEPVYEDQVMDVDFEALRQEAVTEGAAWLCEYFESVTPTKKNKYTGMFEGYNVIFITAEGFSGYLIDPELTPVMYRMSREGFVFENFYSTLHFTSTSGGEFQNLTGLYPKAGFPVSLTETGVQGTYLPFTLANRLNALGYTSTGYHFNGNMYGRDLSHPNLGYEWRQVTDCSRPLAKETDENGNEYWPQSDAYMIEQTFSDYVDSQPFNVYYLTISAHLPYGYDSNQMSQRNWDAVSSLPYSDKTKAYIAANLELEKGLAILNQKLEEAGIADRTVIVMAPDHIPYSDPDILEELAGRSFGTSSLEMLDEQNVDMDIYRNTLLLWSAGMEEPVYVEKCCSQVDILPTLLNLLGVEYDSRMLAGTDVMSDAEPVVICFSNSWRTDRGTYDRYTGTFLPAEGCGMSGEEVNVYVENIRYLADCRLRLGQLIIENDYYRQALP